MNLIKQKCAYCGKGFFRTAGRVNEAKKFGWKPYCSLECQGKEKTRQVVMECGNPSCNNIVSRGLRDFKNSKSGLIFCSHSCAAIFSNSFRRKVRKCQLCGKGFYGTRKLCSKQCFLNFTSINSKVIRVSGQQVISEIQEFCKKHGRIPVKREYYHSKATRKRFGTWNNAIKASGFEPNPVLFAKKHLANDGHRCDSFAEKIIDDWLNEHNIKHERNVSYPENSSFSTDFVTTEHWIEFFGLAGDIKRYDEIMEEKKKLAEKHKLPFVAVFPKDLFPVNRLGQVLKT